MSDEEESSGGDEDGGGGAPAWMATFADLMSLLLAFFVLLFSFSSIDDKRYKLVGGSISEAFGVQRREHLADPVLGVNHIAKEYSSGRMDPTTLNIVAQENLDIEEMRVLSEDSSDEKKEEEKKDKDENIAKEKADAEKAAKKTSEETTQQKLEEQGLLSLQSLQSVSKQKESEGAKESLSMLRKYFQAEEQEGSLQIEIKEGNLVMRITEEGSFPPGSAETVEPFAPLIQKISDVLKEVDGDITVAGHTDSIPIRSSRYRSNWELSTSRAVTVLQGLIDRTGLPPKQFEVQGFGDTRPVAENSTAAGRAQNRRVEVVVALDQIASTLPERLKELIEPAAKAEPEVPDVTELNDQKMEEQTEQMPDPIFNLPKDESGKPDFIFGGSDFFTAR